MKRTAALIAAASLLAAPVAADAATKPAKKKPTTRTVTFNYTGFFGVYASAAGGGGVCQANSCYDLSTLSHETKVTFSAKDATGQKIPVQVGLDDDYDNTTVSCGVGEVPVSKGSVVNFYMIAGPDCPGLPTQGTITMTITGLK